ncbi:hypothetical protein [Stenotrophomonas sp. CFBP8994]|uniref:hypothetical protein n=1 Tax=Stenotrophomonas sp. CFBP8994 TaxID=3096527 RepID=UPI002A69F2A8|nr:hypothetical protein [Stenotrophomonas sp. CFBP8994]MDY0978961.1 hypothetical protein [Stenotrophomonas sp. CFBP8994]
MAAPLKRLERAALIVARGATDDTLKRTRGGFCSPKQPANIFTRRVMNWLYERALLDFDNPSCPACATLTPRGRAAADALVAESVAKAGLA